MAEEEIAEVVEEIEQAEPVTTTDGDTGDTREIVARELTKERARDESGKFTKKEAAPEDAKEEETPPEEAAEPQPAEPEAPKHNPFSAWKKEAQEKLSALPPDVQGMIAERETQFHRGIEQYKEEAFFARSMKKAIAPHAEYLAQIGMSPELALSHLVGAEKKLRIGSPEEKANMFHQLARDYEVDLGQIAQMPFDPNMHRLQQQVQWLQSQIGNTQASQQSAEDERILSRIDEFAQSHEHFGEVHTQMADLIDKGLAGDLDDAYEKAIRLNDAVFEKHQAQQLETKRRQEALKADQAAKAAKAAAVSVKGAPTGITHNATPATTEEAVRQSMKQHGLL